MNKGWKKGEGWKEEKEKERERNGGKKGGEREGRIDTPQLLRRGYMLMVVAAFHCVRTAWPLLLQRRLHAGR